MIIIWCLRLHFLKVKKKLKNIYCAPNLNTYFRICQYYSFQSLVKIPDFPFHSLFVACVDILLIVYFVLVFSQNSWYTSKTMASFKTRDFVYHQPETHLRSFSFHGRTIPCHRIWPKCNCWRSPQISQGKNWTKRFSTRLEI